MKNNYINIELIPKKVDGWERKKRQKKVPTLSRTEKIDRIKRLAEEMDIKIGGI